MNSPTDSVRQSRPRTRRRLLALLAGTMVLLLLALVLSYWAAGRTPSWYQPGESDPASRDSSAADQKVIAVQEWAAGRQAYDNARSIGRRPLVKEPSNELTISFTQDEINALVAKWYPTAPAELRDTFRRPMVRIERDRLTIAATIPALGDRVASLDFRPELRNGELYLNLLSIRSGNLPIPEFTWAKPRQQLITALGTTIVRGRGRAKIDDGGAANGWAINTVLAGQGIDTLEHRSTRNLLFLPMISQEGWQFQMQGLIAKYKSCELSDGALTLVAEPLPPEQRKALLDAINRGSER